MEQLSQHDYNIELPICEGDDTFFAKMSGTSFKGLEP